MPHSAEAGEEYYEADEEYYEQRDMHAERLPRRRRPNQESVDQV
jgi:hypothetical protein